MHPNDYQRKRQRIGLVVECFLSLILPDRVGVRRGRPVVGQESVDGDFSPHRQVCLPRAGPVERGRGAEFDLPIDYLAVRAHDVDVQVAVAG